MKPFVITGIPRSGSALLSKMICLHCDNAYSINETLYNVKELRKDLTAIGGWLIAGEPVPNKYSSKGLTTNLEKGQKVEYRVVDKKFDGNLLIGSKVLTVYLAQIQFIIDQKLSILANIRNPIYTIASWASEKCSKMEVGNVGPEGMSERWGGVPFEFFTKIERMAELWEWHANAMKKLHRSGQIDIIQYENWRDNSIVDEELKAMTEQLPDIDTMNLKSRYNVDWDAIEDAVSRICVSAGYFGYE